MASGTSFRDLLKLYQKGVTERPLLKIPCAWLVLNLCRISGEVTSKSVG